MSELTDAADVLDAAADYIDAHGWCQGDYRNLLGQVCVLGSLESVRSTNASFNDALVVLRAQVRRSSVSGWNDAPGRTQPEVTSTMRAAAADARAKVTA